MLGTACNVVRQVHRCAICAEFRLFSTMGKLPIFQVVTFPESVETLHFQTETLCYKPWLWIWIKCEHLQVNEDLARDGETESPLLLTQKLYTTSCEPHQTYPMFLDGHVSEVHKHVVQFAGAGCVLHCAEPAEAQLVPESRTPERESIKQQFFVCTFENNH